ncbi:hypothetical protein HanXRQr2_Chr17g0784241 [Helianthus annuus]|uniref:Uncharacterized protein n=1 Tax=Helianthus annuus TaxID=4232 RepID=A0A9K3DEE0_HELAN|nr:hypothetical protein HanXRQr2_Chr17g0784241 [Helianthus annuus]
MVLSVIIYKLIYIVLLRLPLFTHLYTYTTHIELYRPYNCCRTQKNVKECFFYLHVYGPYNIIRPV